MSPQRPDFVLATNIPNSKGYILIFHCLNIKTFGKENVREELINNAIKIKDTTIKINDCYHWACIVIQVWIKICIKQFSSDYWK